MENEKLTSMNVSLPLSQRDFVAERVRESYGSASEYIRALIRDDQKRAVDERLEALILAGLSSGDPLPVTRESREELKRELAKRSRTRRAKGK